MAQPLSLVNSPPSLHIRTAGLYLDEFVTQMESSQEFFQRHCLEIRLPVDKQLLLSTFPDAFQLVFLASPDDPDTLMVLPIVDAMTKASPRLTLRIFSDQGDASLLVALVDDDELLSEPLDELDLPLLFAFDQEWNLLGHWGPRPAEADRFLDQWMADHPEYEALEATEDDADADRFQELVDQLLVEMRLAYNSGINSQCAVELTDFLTNLSSASDSSEDEPQPKSDLGSDRTKKGREQPEQNVNKPVPA